MIHWPQQYAPENSSVFVSNAIDISASPETIWAWLIRAQYWPDWYPNSRNVHIENEPGPDLALGTRFRWWTFGVPLESVVEEFVPFERLAWNGRGIGVRVYHAWLIDHRTNGCHVLMAETQNGFLACLQKLIVPNRMHHYHQIWLEQLRVKAEGGMIRATRPEPNAGSKIQDPARQKRRSLILAGGGIKVAFQAGVLEVWLDEACVSFHHADGASGGVLNLAMLCQGMSGRQIADNWRNLDPIGGVALNWRQDLKLLYARSLFTLDAYRKNVFPRWDLDWQQIRSSKLDATFNVYNFSKHELTILQPAQMSEDYLVAGVSLPLWFPPVEIDGNLYIDAVYVTDANIEEAIRRGADEIWVIWTVSEKGAWHDGFVATYFQIIEAAANGKFNQIIRRIQENNTAIREGRPGEFGRSIELKVLKADVALHYLFNFSQDRLSEAVNAGVLQARKWCQDNGIPLRQNGPQYPPETEPRTTTLKYTVRANGFIGLGEKDYHMGFRRGQTTNNHLDLKVTVKITDVKRFVVEPLHPAVATGHIHCPALGGECRVERGTVNLLVDQPNTGIKRVSYRLIFRNDRDECFTLAGLKQLSVDAGGNIWSDSTTLFVRIFRGECEQLEEPATEVIGAGIVRTKLFDALRELTNIRVEGPTLADKADALTRFGLLFYGKLWDVYGQDVLTSGAI